MEETPREHGQPQVAVAGERADVGGGCGGGSYGEEEDALARCTWIRGLTQRASNRNLLVDVLAVPLAYKQPSAHPKNEEEVGLPIHILHAFVANTSDLRYA
jgi:hypothetical protein